MTELLTAREIVQNFKNLYSGGRQTDDVRISDRQWLFNLDHHRAQLIRQQMEKGQAINEANLQSLGQANANQVRVIPIPKRKCGRWYSEVLPAAIELHQQNLYTFVGTACGHAFQKTTAQRAEWEQYAKYTKKSPKWHQLGNSIFLVTPPSPTLNYVTVRGAFENPRAVLAFNGEELDPYDYLEFPYPVSRTSLDTLYKMLETELKLANSEPYDRYNDSEDDHLADTRRA